MSNLLIDERPLVLLPSLVGKVGLERAVILQQVHFAVNQPRSGKILDDGFRYIWNTYEEWAQDHFPFWSPEAIRKHFSKLEDMGLVISKQPNAGRRDHTKYYRIDYSVLEGLYDLDADAESVSIRPPSPHLITETSFSETSQDSVPIGTGVPPLSDIPWRENPDCPPDQIYLIDEKQVQTYPIDLSFLNPLGSKGESPRVSSTERWTGVDTGTNEVLVVDNHSFVFVHGLNFLISSGVKEQQARAFLGKLRKKYHDQDIVAMIQSLPAGRSEYISYMTEVMKKYLPKDHKLKTVEERTAEQEAWLTEKVTPAPKACDGCGGFTCACSSNPNQWTIQDELETV